MMKAMFKQAALTPLSMLWILAILLSVFLAGEWIGDLLLPDLMWEPEPWYFDNM